MTTNKKRDVSHIDADTKVLHNLVQAAIEVELFTIPLYMTTLYSIKGLYTTSDSTQQLWPGMRPNSTADTPSQKAYNVIFSVYIQEMLHLQLVSNIATGLGHNPKLPVPKYSGGSVIPCIGDLKKIPDFKDVKVELGPLNQNQIDLFLAIELPDWDVKDPSQKKPSVPFAAGIGSKTTNLPEFGTIGHLYECIEEYLNIQYKDSSTLFDNVYVPNSVQVDLFDFHQKYHEKSEYPGFATRLTRSYETATFFANKSADKVINDEVNSVLQRLSENEKLIKTIDKITDKIIDTNFNEKLDQLTHLLPEPELKKEIDKVRIMDMITAILDQGEGASSTQTGVPSRYAPVKEDVAADRGEDDACVRALWDQKSHYERFADVKNWMADEQIQTWPEWHKTWHKDHPNKGPWTANDLLAKPSSATTQEKTMAAQRANAMNDSTTAAELNNALNHSFSNLLTSMQTSWKDASWDSIGNPNISPQPQVTSLFPFAAMQALYTRVSTIWATNGTPEFLAVTPNTDKNLHACQGLDPNNPGLNSCATAVPHTCAGANSCKNQGGCGYPSTYWPGANEAAGDGGCGAPIPDSQVLSNLPSPIPTSPSLSPEPQKGDSVYDTAWDVFIQGITTDPKPTKPAPNNLRLVLPPS